MRVRLAAPKARGLHPIPLLPDLRLCRLEGRNGIGKTLAVRLLELADGSSNPYATMPAAWGTLRDQLGGPVSVSVDGLLGGATVQFELTPDRWPEDPDALTDDLLGTAQVNGRGAAWAEARALVQFFRVGGEESLRQTVGQEIDLRALRVERAARAVSGRREAWDLVLSDVTELGNGLDPSSLPPAWVQAAAAGQTLALAHDQQAASQDRHRNAIDLETATALAAGAALRLPGLLEARARAEAAVQALEADLAASDDKVAQAAAAAASGGDVLALLSKAEGLRAQRERRRMTSESAEREWLRRLGLAERPDPPALQALVSGTRLELKRAKETVERLDLTDPLRRLTTGLLAPFQNQSSRLDDQELLESPRLTVKALREALAERHAHLRNRPRPDEEIRATRELDRLTTRRDALGELADAILDTNRKRALVRESTAELERLLATLAKGSGAAYLRSRQEQESVRAALVDAEVERRRIEQALLELVRETGDDAARASALADLGRLANDPAAASAVRDRLLRPMLLFAGTVDAAGLRHRADALRLPAADGQDRLWSEFQALVGGVVERAAAADTQARARHEAAERDADAAWAQTASAHARVLRSLRALSEEPRWEPLRTAVDSVCLRAGSGSLSALARHVASADWDGPECPQPILMAASVLHEVALAAETVAETAGELSRRMVNAGAYLRRLSQKVHPQGPSASDASAAGRTRLDQGVVVPGEAVLQSWAERELAAVFSVPELRRELFDGADRVGFDLDGLVVRWPGPDGRPRRRALEAFSSGEQAFAYTRAKLDAIQGRVRPGAQVLLVLDEFGAFVARDRLGMLMRFVTDQALEKFASQAVVMLPLSEDHERPSGTPDRSGDGPDPLRSHASQVQDWDYFCEDVPTGRT